MIFIGTSGILGRFVPVDAVPAVWWRAFIAMLLLAGFCWWKGFSFRIADPKRLKLVMLSGVLMMGHWVMYFYALKLSSVAIGMLSIFTYPAMTTLLEPLLLKKPFQPRHLLLAFLVIVGIYFLAPSFDLADGATLGLCLGLLSAFVYSLRNILMKTQIDALQGSVLMTYQAGITALLLLPTWYYFNTAPPAAAWPYLIGLGLLTTAIGHTLLLGCFRYFSASTASLLTCVQPVYGILMGVVFFQEIPGWSAVLGGALILSAVVVEARATMRKAPVA
ncbi:DMT family transporter [Neolewinella persica]|uniref:DMT family transporter n=1 Tax=Neolewinella persica TaxID=70998 RepID=UPI0003759826|nr:DMT family transporter [Neolewinella persica]